MGDPVDRKLLLGLSLVAVWASVWVALHIHNLGWRIVEVIPEPLSPLLGLDYAMGLVWWSALAFALLVLGGASRQMLFVAWVAKLFVTLVLMLFFESHYGLDAFWYYRATVTGYHDFFPYHDFRHDLTPSLGSFLGKSLGIPGSANAVRLILWIAAVTGPFYHAIKVVCAFLGLLGVWWFYQAVVVALGRPYPPVFYLLAFFPSILFWSSILGKDPIQFFFLGLYAYGAVLWFVRGRLGGVLLTAAGLLGVYLLRPWLTVMAAGAILLAACLGRARIAQVAVLMLVGIPLLLFAGGRTAGMLDLQKGLSEATSATVMRVALEAIESRMTGFAQETKRSGGSGVDLLADQAQGTTTVTFGSHLPMIVFSGLFRPLPFDITNPLTALAAAENTFAFCLAIAALFHFRLGYLRDPLVLWPALYCLAWATAYGLIVMGNFGSGARFKLQMWPFFLVLVFGLIHREGRAVLAARLAMWRKRSGRLPAGRSNARAGSG